MALGSRRWILTWIVVVLLLTALPGAIRTYLQTGVFYPFSHQFFADMIARLSGPGRMRFVMQPIVAILLGSRDGIKDAKAGASPFLWGLVHQQGHRKQLLQSAYASVQNLVAIAVLLDLISQYLIFHDIHPGAALLLGPVLIGTPYALSRALGNRLFAWRSTP